VVLLDLEMPVMDGYEAAGRLRKMQAPAEAAAAHRRHLLQRRHAQHRARPQLRLRRLPRQAGGARDALGGARRQRERAPGSETTLPMKKIPCSSTPDLRATLPDFLRSRREALDELPHALAAATARSSGAWRTSSPAASRSTASNGPAPSAARCRTRPRQGEAADLARRVSVLRAHLDKVVIQ
jgi:hypothetical protein